MRDLEGYGRKVAPQPGPCLGYTYMPVGMGGMTSRGAVQGRCTPAKISSRPQLLEVGEEGIKSFQDNSVVGLEPK